jgi:hypothetical protein
MYKSLTVALLAAGASATSTPQLRAGGSSNEILNRINGVLEREMSILAAATDSSVAPTDTDSNQVCHTHDPTFCHDVVTPSTRFKSRFAEPLQDIKKDGVVYYCSVDGKPMPDEATGFSPDMDEGDSFPLLTQLTGASCNPTKGVISAVKGDALTISWNDGGSPPTEPEGGWKTGTVGLVDATPGPVAFVGAVLYGNSATLVPVPLYDIRHFMENSRTNLAFDGFSLYRKPKGDDPVFDTWKREIEALRDARGGLDQPANVLEGSKFNAADQTSNRPAFVAAAKAVFESADGVGAEFCEPDSVEIGNLSPKCRGPKEKCVHGPVFSAGVVSVFF